MPSLPPGRIAPPLFSARNDYAKSGRTVGAVSSHHASVVCLYPTPTKPIPQERRTTQYESNVYLVGAETLPLRSVFISDTSVQWVKTREFFENEKLLPEQYRPLLPDTLEGYSMTLKGHLRRLEEDGTSKSTLDHYQSVDAIFDLFLLMTAGKSDRGVFGEDLLDWLNRHYVSPTSEEGLNLADQAQPWLDPSFWQTLTKYAIRGIMPPLNHFLDLLQSHPSSFVKPLATRLRALAERLPRATIAPGPQFAVLKKQWNQLLASFRSELESLPASQKEETWWQSMNDIVHVFEGDEMTIRRICREHGLGWLELICVWGLWGDDTLERHHMPEFATSVESDMPMDPTELEERIMKEIFQNEFSAAAQSCSELDTWLGAHLADLMQAEGLIDSAITQGSDLSLRDHCVLTYAESILNDPGQWMIAVDYMRSCGRIGLGMADEVVSRIAFTSSMQRPGNNNTDFGTGERDANGEADTIIPIHAIRYCQDNNRRWVLDGLIRTAARHLADNGRLGEALAYSLSAEDAPGIDRVVGLAMEQFESKGGDSLIAFVKELPPALSTQHRRPGPRRWQGLSFLLNYAELHLHMSNGDFHQGASHLAAMFRQDMIPLRWWVTALKDAEAILVKDEDLYFSKEDAYQILSQVEQLETRFSRDRSVIGELGQRRQTSQDTISIRRALAKYFARLVFGGRIS